VKLESGVPAMAIRDLEIWKCESDPAAASFGRGFFLLDDYSTLRRLTLESLTQEAWLAGSRETGERRGDFQ
jgi:hypothetical protein